MRIGINIGMGFGPSRRPQATPWSGEVEEAVTLGVEVAEVNFSEHPFTDGGTYDETSTLAIEVTEVNYEDTTI